MSTDNRNIVIIGGGIIGCTTAYYLTRHASFSASSTTVTLLEASSKGAAQGASGKAGGLVAKWAYPRALVDVSFPEHVKLAEEHGGAERWGWRFVGCGSWTGRGDLGGGNGPGMGVGEGGDWKSLEKTNGLDGSKKSMDVGFPDDLNWVREDLTEAYSPMSGPGGTAQVHPYLFTTSMLDLAKERGVNVITGKATSINQSSGKVTSVTYTGESQAYTVPATDIILAAGAWSPTLLPALPITATRAHSITIRPPAAAAPIAAYVLFTDIELPRGVSASPEIYARPDDEVYVCGPGDDSALPDCVDDVSVDQGACSSIHEQVASISPQLGAGEVTRRQACFLPVVSTGGGPIVGEAGHIAKGLYIATGHTCWGISNAPGTAKAMSELVMDGKIRCANLKTLQPARFL